MLKIATKFKPLRPSLEMAHRAGFRHAEIWLDAAVLADWEQVSSLAREYPFEYALHFPNKLNLSHESLVQATQLYQALHCRTMVIHEPMFERYHAPLMQLLPSLNLAIENHFLSVEEIAEWGEASPGLTLDVEHLWKFTLGEVPLQKVLDETARFLARFRQKLRHVHLPGYRPGGEEHRPMYYSRDMVFGILDLLSSIQFEGLIVSEIDSAFQTPQDLKMDMLLIDRWREARA